jgi:hypothetical protein
VVTTSKAERRSQAIDELKKLIADRFPEARFDVVKGSDPPGTYLEVHVDDEDATDDIFDTVMERLLTFQDKERLGIYVIPLSSHEPISPA